jgi:hypothetical protein
MLTFFGFFTCLLLIAMLIVPAMHARLNHGQQALAGAGLVYFLIAVSGVWLIVYFNLRSVRQVFIGSTVYLPDSLAYPAPPFALNNLAGASAQPTATAPVHGYASVPLQEQQRAGTAAITFARVVVLFFAVLACVGAILDLVLAALRKPSVYYLGRTLHPPTATIALVIFAGLHVAIALGLFRRFEPAYYAAIVLHLCNMTSWAMQLAHFPRSSGKRVVAATHVPSLQLPHSAAFFQGMRISFIVLYAVFGLLALWAFLSEIAVMRRAARNITQFDESTPSSQA